MMRSTVDAVVATRDEVLSGERMLYARGFVVSDGAVQAPTHWSKLVKSQEVV